MGKSVARTLLAALCCSSVAFAGPFDTFGFGPRAAAMAGAQTADANDYSATFYNPALLGKAKKVNVGAYFNYFHMASQVTAKDISKSLDCKYCAAPDVVGGSIGAVFPFQGKLKERVALGVGFYLPAGKMIRLFGPDSSTPYWYQYNSNPERLVIQLGVGVKITDWLSVGLGAHALADLIAEGANVRVDLFSKQVKARDIDARLETRVSPVIGLSITPIKPLRFGVTYRGEMKLIYDIPASVDLEGIGTLGFRVGGVAHYSPHTVQFGVAYDVSDAVTLSLDGEVALWSQAPSPYMGVTIDLSGKTLAALGLDNALDLTSAEQKPGFTDTFGGKLGAEFRVHQRVAVRAGTFVRPTPVPLQNVPGTNLMDSTTIGATAGVDVNFDDPLEIFGHPVHVELTGHSAFLLGREATKDSFDSQPSYTYSAVVFGLMAGLKYEF